MIKAILFDYDGTLSDRYAAAYDMYRWVVHRIFPALAEDSYEFEAIVQRCLQWDEFGCIDRVHPFQMIKEKYAPDLDVSYWEKEWFANFYRFQRLQPHCTEVLEALGKRYRLGIITNGPQKNQLGKIRQLQLEPYFETVIVSGAFGKDKPDVSIYQKAADNLGLACEECAFIGDTFSTDIIGAMKSGMLPIWFIGDRRGVSCYDVQTVANYKEIADFFLK